MISWSHPDLATLSNEAVTTEMIRLEDALLGIIGMSEFSLYTYYILVFARKLTVHHRQIPDLHAAAIL
jgi:peptidoglycan/xylan/chitin deacetylase (PgdA/CDA1 family)